MCVWQTEQSWSLLLRLFQDAQFICAFQETDQYSQMFYTWVPLPPPQNRNNCRLKASPMPEDDRAKSFPRQRTHWNHEVFTWVRTNWRTSPRSVTIWLKRQWVNFVFSDQNYRLDREMLLPQLSWKRGVMGLVLLRSFQNLGYHAENWLMFCSLKWGIFCLHCLATTSCRIWLQHGSILT